MRVWSDVESDVALFLQALETKNYAEAVELYTGPFLQGAYLNDWGIELEEWIYEQRESLAARAQDAMLNLAEIYASQGRFSDAAKLAERAFELEGAPAPEPELLPRYYALLIADNSHLIAKVKEEAEFYDIKVDLAPDEARGRLQSTFVGRETERERLEKLGPGQWVWLRGAAGMGKTALLQSLSGTYLQARSGLPYATLEPLLGTALEEGKDVMLRKLAQLEGNYLLDPWEWMDEESQSLLRQLRDVRPLTLHLSSPHAKRRLFGSTWDSSSPPSLKLPWSALRVLGKRLRACLNWLVLTYEVNLWEAPWKRVLTACLMRLNRFT